MAKHASVLRRFEVYSEQDDGGVRIDHQYKDCDWDVFIDGYRLTDLMRQATAHAKVCDGKPQPRPEPKPRPEGFRNSFISDVWRQAILTEYARSVLIGIPADGTRVLLADEESAQVT